MPSTMAMRHAKPALPCASHVLLPTAQCVCVCMLLRARASQLQGKCHSFLQEAVHVKVRGFVFFSEGGRKGAIPGDCKKQRAGIRLVGVSAYLVAVWTSAALIEACDFSIAMAMCRKPRRQRTLVC